MIYLKKEKRLLENESYIYGKKGKEKILVPIHTFEKFASICPRCGKIEDIDIDVIIDILQEDGEFENVNISCEKCSKFLKK